MAKRFTDTDKHKDPWFRKLEPRLKMLFLFMCDDCNHAGIWKENFDLYKLLYGYEVQHDDLKALGEKILKINEDTYLIQSFIKFQYGVLNPTNKAHLGVIRALSYAGIDYGPYVAPAKDLASSLGIGTGEGKGTKEEAGISKEKGKGGSSPISIQDIPF